VDQGLFFSILGAVISLGGIFIAIGVMKGKLQQAVETSAAQTKQLESCAMRDELTGVIKCSDEMLDIMRKRVDEDRTLGEGRYKELYDIISGHIERIGKLEISKNCGTRSSGDSMAKDSKWLEAEKLYIKNGLSCSAIAESLGVNEGTIYRWKAEAASKGEAADWDSQRRVYNMSPREMFAIYAETVKSWIAQIHKTPELLSDGKIAAAIVKHVSVLQKLDTRSQYLGVALDLIKIANQ
jgi:hypothetical protein